MSYDLKKYIGRPYEQCDCLKLVQEIYKDIFDLDVKNYFEGGVPPREEVASLIKTNRGDFAEVSSKDLKFGDIIVLKLYGIECHLAVYVEGGKIIHSAKNIGSCMDRLERYSRMIAGYYRHREAV